MQDEQINIAGHQCFRTAIQGQCQKFGIFRVTTRTFSGLLTFRVNLT
jgi:hypothetical protein